MVFLYHTFLAAHAVLGCDTVAHVYIGKGTVVSMLLKSHTLDKLSDSEAEIKNMLKSPQILPLHVMEVTEETMSGICYDIWISRTGEGK